MTIFEFNLYGDLKCPVCQSTDILIRSDSETCQTIDTPCMACEKKKFGIQGVIAWKRARATTFIKSHFINIYWPFGYLLKRLRFTWTHKPHRTDGWCFKLVYTEQFIPKTLWK